MGDTGGAGTGPGGGSGTGPGRTEPVPPPPPPGPALITDGLVDISRPLAYSNGQYWIDDEAGVA